MKAINTWVAATSLGLSSMFVACGGDDDSSGDGDGDVTPGDGDGDGSGGTSGDGDGDSSGGTSGDGDGDGDASGGMGGGSSCSTILELAEATPDLSSLLAAVEAADLTGALGGEDLTVFAPTNDAFATLLEALDAELGDLTADQLVPILTYHVAASVADSAAAVAVAGSDDNTLTTLGGALVLDVDGDDLVIDMEESAATVVMADIEACNGVVHVVDQVLLPSIADIVVSQDRFSGLETLIGSSDTDPVNVGVALDGPASEGAWTLFAPDNDAVQALIDADLGLTEENVTTALLYHAYDAENAVDAATALTLDTTIQTAGGEDLDVVGNSSEGTVTLMDGAGNDVMVTTVDIHAFNGIIHVIDGVLIPPSLD